MAVNILTKDIASVAIKHYLEGKFPDASFTVEVLTDIQHQTSYAYIALYRDGMKLPEGVRQEIRPQDWSSTYIQLTEETEATIMLLLG